MKIYTKTGDRGETSLRNGQRVKKSDSRIWLVGELDELTAILGLSSSFSNNTRIIRQIEEVQRDLFLIAAWETAGLEKRTGYLEKTIDEIDQDLPVLRNFLFLGGSQSASFLYLARSVCRRVERQICQMSQRRDLQSLLPTYVGISQMGKVLVYLNRLSDFLFVLARFENQINKVKEKILKK